jgi:hypothetical protein
MIIELNVIDMESVNKQFSQDELQLSEFLAKHTSIAAEHLFWIQQWGGKPVIRINVSGGDNCVIVCVSYKGGSSEMHTVKSSSEYANIMAKAMAGGFNKNSIGASISLKRIVAYAKIVEENESEWKSKLEEKNKRKRKNKRPYTYLLHDGRYHKIGQSVDPIKRLKAIKTSNPGVIMVCFGRKTREAELHKRFAHMRVKGEWFELIGPTLSRVFKLIGDEDKNHVIQEGHHKGRRVYEVSNEELRRQLQMRTISEETKKKIRDYLNNGYKL